MATAERGGEKYRPAWQWNSLETQGTAMNSDAEEEQRSELQRRQCNGIAQSRDARQRNGTEQLRQGIAMTSSGIVLMSRAKKTKQEDKKE